jgi:hypothetical protein
LNNTINTFTEIVIENPTKKQIEELCSNNPVAKLDKRIIILYLSFFDVSIVINDY